jgi:hypothetical protein
MKLKLFEFLQRLLRRPRLRTHYSTVVSEIEGSAVCEFIPAAREQEQRQ